MKVNYKRPWLTNYQRDILNSPARFSVTQAATKTGKTASHVVWLFEQALQGKDGQQFWWVAPTYTQSKEAFTRMKRQITSRQLFTANNSDLTITLVTGAIMVFKTAEKPDNLYGSDVYAAVFDEFTRAREEAWAALRTTLTATKGKCKFIGNVKGRKNWGHKLWLRANNDPEMEAFKITYPMAVQQDLPGADIDEMERAKKDMPPHLYKELYLCEPQEDSQNPFGFDAIEACLVDGLSENPPAFFGVDLAKYQDWTVIIGLDEYGKVAYLNRFQGKQWSVTEQIILEAIGGNPACIDATGVGDPIVEMIQDNVQGTEAFKYNATSKRQLITNLTVAINKQEIGVPRDTIIEEELKWFEFEYTRNGIRYNAPQGLTDDAVNSLALAVRCFSTFSHELEFKIM